MQLKPRNKQLNEMLRATKSERHDAKAGKLAKRAKVKHSFKRELSQSKTAGGWW